MKKRSVIKFCKENVSELGFVVGDDISIVDYMIERLSEDAEFKNRQSILGSVASLFKVLGPLNFIKRFPNFLPYMKLTFTKIN